PERKGRCGMAHVSRVARRIFIALLPLTLVLLGAAPFGAKASNVQFVGTAAYSYAGNSVVLTADKVENFDSSGYSGTLKLELWALAAPYTSGSVTGYKLAEYTLGQLSAGFYYYNINSGSIFFSYPPNGTWHFAMFVTEYVASPLNGGYVFDDWINFSTPVVIGPSTPPTPPPPAV